MREQEATPRCRSCLWEMIFSDVARGSSHPLSHFSPLRQSCPKFGGFFQSLLPFLWGRPTWKREAELPLLSAPHSSVPPHGRLGKSLLLSYSFSFFFFTSPPNGTRVVPSSHRLFLIWVCLAWATPHSFSSLYTQYLSQSLECSVVASRCFMYQALGGLTPGWPGSLLM